MFWDGNVPRQVFPIVVWAPSPGSGRFMVRLLLREAGIDHESDQVKQEHSVDALALRGDEGRGTLR
jgi:hypothetical protein